MIEGQYSIPDMPLIFFNVGAAEMHIKQARSHVLSTLDHVARYLVSRTRRSCSPRPHQIKWKYIWMYFRTENFIKNPETDLSATSLITGSLPPRHRERNPANFSDTPQFSWLGDIPELTSMPEILTEKEDTDIEKVQKVLMDMVWSKAASCNWPSRTSKVAVYRADQSPRRSSGSAGSSIVSSVRNYGD